MARKAKKDSVIVSLTSFGKRMKCVPDVVGHIMEGTMKPHKVVLTLTEEDATNMPDELRKMIDDNVIDLLVSDSDIKGHKKYFDAMMTYRDYPIVTVDDDFIYDSTLLEKLYASYKEHPDSISCAWVRPFFVDDDMSIKVDCVKKGDEADSVSPSGVVAISGSGALFPPSCLKLSEGDVTCMSRFVDNTDEVILYFAKRAGVDVVQVGGIDNTPMDRDRRKGKTGKGMNSLNADVLNEIALPFFAAREDKCSESTARPDGISICISAYKTRDYIKATLDSIASQTWFKTHDCYEILVGVDGDQELCDYLRDEIMGYYKNIRVFMMQENCGTYITTNTVMKQAKYSNLIRFDSDDIMYDDLVESLIPYVGYDIVRFGCYDGPMFRPRDGVIMMRSAIFEEFGGYMPWRCAGDTQFLKRTRKFVNMFTLNKGLFMCVSRADSLTHDPKTNMSSDLRQRYRREIAASSYPTRESAVISCKTSPFTEVFATSSVDKDAYIDSIVVRMRPGSNATLSAHIVPTRPMYRRQPSKLTASPAWNPNRISRSKTAVIRNASRPFTARKEEPAVSKTTNRPESRSHRQGQPSYIARPVWSPVRKSRDK